MAGSVLEENLPPEVVRTQRLRMIQESVRTSQLIAKFWPEEWSEELALRNLRRVYTYAIGYWKDCFPSENVWKAIPENFSNIGSQRELYQEELLYMCRLIWVKPIATAHNRVNASKPDSTPRPKQPLPCSL